MKLATAIALFAFSVIAEPPPSITIKKEVQIPLLSGGKEIGTATIETGTRFTAYQVKGQSIAIKSHGRTVSIPIDYTDYQEQVDAMAKQGSPTPSQNTHEKTDTAKDTRDTIIQPVTQKQETVKDLPKLEISALHGDATIAVKSASVKIIKMTDMFGDKQISKEPQLLIEVEITNNTGTKKMDYNTWRGHGYSFGRDFATLSDTSGNRYKLINYGHSSTPIGGIKKSESIYPQKSITDMLVFELPVEGVKSLLLELPAENFGGEGEIRLEIPMRTVIKP